MIHLTMPVEHGGYTAELTTYILDNFPEMGNNKVRPCVVICPGGGYGFVSDREAEPIAVKLNSMGVHACVLRYSVAPAEYPVQAVQLAKAILTVRRHSGDWHIDNSRVIAGGFSAGAHLCAMLGVHFNDPFLCEAAGASPADIRPDGMLLCYPVITSGEYAHRGSFEKLLCGKYAELSEFASVERQVRDDTPPAFIWHTWDDKSVPVQNSLLMAQALLEHNVSTELHIFKHGIHGLALATAETADVQNLRVQEECACWVDMFAAWLKTL